MRDFSSQEPQVWGDLDSDVDRRLQGGQLWVQAGPMGKAWTPMWSVPIRAMSDRAAAHCCAGCPLPRGKACVQTVAWSPGPHRDTGEGQGCNPGLPAGAQAHTPCPQYRAQCPTPEQPAPQPRDSGPLLRQPQGHPACPRRTGAGPVREGPGKHTPTSPAST